MTCDSVTIESICIRVNKIPVNMAVLRSAASIPGFTSFTVMGTMLCHGNMVCAGSLVERDIRTARWIKIAVVLDIANSLADVVSQSPSKVDTMICVVTYQVRQRNTDVSVFAGGCAG